MHLAFVDIAYGYTADRPDSDQPLGGTTSAVCFLARELIKAGIACTFFNTLDQPRLAHGIPSLPLQALTGISNDSNISAFIFCGRWMEGMVQFVREKTRSPLVAWMHESSFNVQLVPALDAFDAIAFVSAWQQRINQSFVRAHWKQAVLRNAINPRVAALFASQEPILAAKTKPQTLLYAGAFPRGAFHIPKLLDYLRPLQSDFSVEIYCNTNPSNHASSDIAYINWLRGLSNVTYVGMVGQIELIKRMQEASVMIAPNLWPETSCIALMEAMAAGMSVITTDRAALPETSSGFAKHISIKDKDHPHRFDAALPYEEFANAVSQAMNDLRLPETEGRLRTQVDYFLANYQWEQRVKPWIEFLETLQ